MKVKKSKSIEEAAIWQVKYYLYYLKRLGIEEVTGIIDYPLLRKI
ncbi:Dna2/Cas4 domain-containing protein [Thermoclostridium stercorarium]